MNGYSRTTLIGTLSLIIALGNSPRMMAQVNPGTTQTPFGTIPTPPVAPSPPGVPGPFQFPPPLPPQATTPDDISLLQKCYQSLQDPAACQRLVADQANWDVRFFEVKYANLEALREALSIFRANFNVSSSLRVLAVKAPKEIMPAIEDAIKRLDVQPAAKKSVELTMYLLKATDQQSGGSIPQVLQPVVNQLKTVLAYKGYEVMDTQVVRGTDGSKVSTSGSLPGVSLAPTLSNFYNFNAS